MFSLGRPSKCELRYCYESICFFVTAMHQLSVFVHPEETRFALADELRYIPDSKKVISYTRMKKGKEVFHSSAYMKVRVRNSYTVSYRFGENTKFGQILYFFQHKASCPGTGSCMFNCTCLAFNYAMIQELSPRYDLNLVTDNPCNMHLSHVILVVKGSKTVVPLSNVGTKIVFISYKEQECDPVDFVAILPNKLEKD